MRYDANRPNAAARGYGSRWRTIRARFLQANPFCDVCGELATDVDHEPERRVLVERGVPDPDDERYLRPKCHSHHSAKTARRMNERRRKG